GNLVGLEVDVGEFELLPADAVAGFLVTEGILRTGFDRDTDLTQLLLVTLEHPLERLIGLGAVTTHHAPDVTLGHEVAGYEQADDEVHQPLALSLLRHPAPPLEPVTAGPEDPYVHSKGSRKRVPVHPRFA